MAIILGPSTGTQDGVCHCRGTITPHCTASVNRGRFRLLGRLRGKPPEFILLLRQFPEAVVMHHETEFVWARGVWFERQRFAANPASLRRFRWGCHVSLLVSQARRVVAKSQLLSAWIFALHIRDRASLSLVLGFKLFAALATSGIMEAGLRSRPNPVTHKGPLISMSKSGRKE
jgi:hypothetical protein